MAQPAPFWTILHSIGLASDPSAGTAIVRKVSTLQKALGFSREVSHVREMESVAQLREIMDEGKPVVLGLVKHDFEKCETMVSVMERMSKKHNHNVSFVKVDCSAHEAFCMSRGVKEVEVPQLEVLTETLRKTPGAKKRKHPKSGKERPNAMPTPEEIMEKWRAGEPVKFPMGSTTKFAMLDLEERLTRDRDDILSRVTHPGIIFDGHLNDYGVLMFMYRCGIIKDPVENATFGLVKKFA